MNQLRSLGLSLSALLLAVVTVAFGQVATQTVRVISLPGRPLPAVVAEQRGTFAKNGLNVQVEVAPSSDVLRGALAAGKADIAHAAVDNAVAMVETAAADVVIVLGGENSQNELIAQPGIHSVSELRGRTLIVDALNTAYALQLKKMLLANGLKPDRDYEMKLAGATPLRLKAMRENKDYAATMLGPPFSIFAKSEGFVNLGPAEAIIGRSQDKAAIVRRAWAREHTDALVRYLAAYVEAQRWLLAPPNKEQVIELLAKESGLPASVAAETYAVSLKGHGGYQVDARLDVDGFKNVLKLRAEIEGQWGGRAPAAEKYYDLSFYRMALAKLKPTK